MADSGGHHVRHVVVRARLQLLTLLVTGVLALLVIHFFVSPLLWSAWVIGVVALLVSMSAWVVWGTRLRGSLASCAVTWAAHVTAAAALFILNGYGVAAIAAGVVYGSLWAAVLLLPLGLEALLMRLRASSLRRGERYSPH
ncbi:hypothetical protein [Tessaracoccus oleiagri]|nr:hypothetical protein [Tessaracoccus oleiagri]